MNQSKSVEKGRGNSGAAARLLALAAAIFVLGALAGTAHALNPIMHNSSSVGSSYWGGGWGNTPNSKYGQFTCTTCHAAGPSSGNVKQVKANIVAPGNGSFPGSAVVFHSSTSYGSDYISRTSSNRVCEVCHTVTKHHRYDNRAATTHKGDRDCVACHLHSKGFKKMTVEGGGPCSDCHADLYGSPGTYGMHSDVARMSYKHYLDNDQQTTTTGPAGIPDGTSVNVTSRRCTMCHVEHNVFAVQATETTGRAFNLRDRADGTVTNVGYNDDYNLCLSCHYQGKTKYQETPNGSTKVISVPFQGLTYANATSVLTFSTHGYAVTSRFDDANLGNSTFRGICVKCHNDTIGGNGELGGKSSENGQDSAFKFGEHNSTIPSRFAVFGTMFYQRPATGTTLSYNAVAKTITIAPSPGWVADMHLGHTTTVTAGTGSNQRMRVISNTADTLTLATAFPVALDTNSMIDIADDNMSVDDTCFACHSRAGQDKSASYSGMDWYNQRPMKSALEGIKDLFVGDSGTLATKLSSAQNITVTTQKSWGIGALVGYQFKTPGGTRTISAQASASTGSGPYSTSFTISPRLTSGTGAFEILKPSSHPLDGYSRHDSNERTAPYPGWNKGDSGSTSASTGAGSITDSTKSWSGAEFAGMYIWFPGSFDSSGNPAKSVILNSGGAGVVNFTPITGFTPSSAGGDNYFIGTETGAGRHAACADCHNTHATFNNPEGHVTSAGSYTLIAADSTNRAGWRDDLWSGFLLRVRSTLGVEQIRYVTGFNNALGQYTVSLPWSTIPDSSYSYEVLMGDKWTAAGGQSGGRAGSGSSGSWGVIVTGWRVAAPTAGFNNMTTPLGYRMLENIFDNVSSAGLRGSPKAGQRDLCVKCHSSYSFGVVTPSTPSGNASGNPARSTDVAKEFNPNNLAHHAVYARGNNQPLTAGATGYKAGTTTAAGTTTTVVDSSLGTPPSTLLGKAVVVLTGPAQGQARMVSAVSSNTLTMATAFSVAPGSGAKYALLNSFNPNWPVYNGLGTGTVTISGGVATLTSGYKVPRTTLPGWFLYCWSDNTWRELRTVDTESSFTVTGADVSSSPFILTAGLGSTFVPPFGPWSVLRCTDCHGTTKTDPVGPHASVNKWLIKDADTMSFDYFTGGADSNITTINPGLPTSVVKPKSYFCYNCHRRDVYGDKDMRNPTSYALSRQPHANYIDTNANTVDDTKTKWGVHCRMCHGGDVVGGIHGTNRRHTSTPSGGSNDIGKRFLNGSAWGTHTLGVKRGTTQVVGGCYTLGSPADATVDNCAHTHSGTSYVNKATYDYDTP